MSNQESENFITIDIAEYNSDIQKNLLSINDESFIEVDVKKELILIEEQYKNFLQSSENLDLKISDDSSLQNNLVKMRKFNSNFKNLKKRLDLISENIKIVQENSKKKTESEVIILFKNVKELFTKVRNKYEEIKTKAKENLDFQDEEVSEKLKENNKLIIESDEDENLPLDQNKIYHKLEDFYMIKTYSEETIKKKKASRYNEDIKKLTNEIQIEINEQAEDLSKLEELLDDENSKKKTIRFTGTKRQDQLLTNNNSYFEHQSRTNTYLAAWCVGSVLLFTLMILLKFVVVKSHMNEQHIKSGTF